MYCPKISVIIPFYNNGKTIRRCINSVLKQSFQYLELILIDDGSEDDSLTICKNTIKDDSRARIFVQDNFGVSAARNKGLEEAKGEYVCFLDADDEYLDGAFQIVADLINESNADMVIGGMIEKKGDTTNYLRPFLKDKSFKKIYKDKELDLLRRWTIERNQKILVNRDKIVNDFRMGSSWAKFIKRKRIQGLTFNTKLGLSEDLIFIYQALSEIQNLQVSNEILYVYCRNKVSVTQRKFDSKRIKDNLELVSNLMYIRNDYDYSFEQYIYRKVLICYWDSIIIGVSDKQSLKTGKEELRVISEKDNYSFCFSKLRLRFCTSAKELILAIFLKTHSYAILFLISRFFSEEK